jgi:hypothetical protein
MQTLLGRTLGILGLASLGLAGCSSPMSPNGTPNGATVTGAVANTTTTTQDAGWMAAVTGPLRCAPSPGMLDACSGKASGDGCALSGKRDGGWSLPGSCRSTFDGAGLACVPTPPGPPGFLANACSGKAAGGACTVTGPAGNTFDGTCRTGRANSTLFCGRAHSPPAAVVEACSGKAAGDACSRPERKDGGSKPGVCRNGPSGDLACRPAEAFGTAACVGLDAGATCTLGGHRPGKEGLTGSCVVPAAGGAPSCVVSCVDLFQRFHHRHHRFGGPFGGGGPWWKQGHSDAGSAAP